MYTENAIKKTILEFLDKNDKKDIKKIVWDICYEKNTNALHYFKNFKVDEPFIDNFLDILDIRGLKAEINIQETNLYQLLIKTIRSFDKKPVPVFRINYPD